MSDRAIRADAASNIQGTARRMTAKMHIRLSNETALCNEILSNSQQLFGLRDNTLPKSEFIRGAISQARD